MHRFVCNVLRTQPLAEEVMKVSWDMNLTSCYKLLNKEEETRAAAILRITEKT